MDTDAPSEEEIARKFGYEEDYLNGRMSWWQKTRPKVWSLFDEPYSSWMAKVRLQTKAVSVDAEQREREKGGERRGQRGREVERERGLRWQFY